MVFKGGWISLPQNTDQLAATMSLGLVTRQMRFIPNTKLKQPGTWEAKDKAAGVNMLATRSYINILLFINAYNTKLNSMIECNI